MKTYTFVRDLPLDVQTEMLADAMAIWSDWGVRPNAGIIAEFMSEKIADVVGCCDGLLSEEKYGKYIAYTGIPDSYKYHFPTDYARKVKKFLSAFKIPYHAISDKDTTHCEILAGGETLSAFEWFIAHDVES